MSNARIFCLGFVMNCVVFGLLPALGVSELTLGLQGTSDNFLFAMSWGIAAVALVGDRHTMEDAKNG